MMFRLLLALPFVLAAMSAAAEPPQRMTLKAPNSLLAGQSCRVLGWMGNVAPSEIALTRTFLDDFDSFDLSSGPWTPHFAHNSYDDWRARTLEGNAEEQIYVDPGYKGSGDQQLRLSAHDAQSGILDLVADRTKNTALHPFRYVSGMITSYKNFAQTYGYFEIKARLPRGQGLWPAFWLLRPGMWPPEIDVMEVLGHDLNTLHATVHWQTDGERLKTGCKIPLEDASKEFNLYGVLWTDGMIVHYINRKPVSVVKTKAEMDGPMYMLANLAVGGTWPGAPDDETMFPARYEIDWIAAYQLADE